MIFIDRIQQIEKILEPEFDRLLDIAFKRQTHIGDLLLLYINGFYDKNTQKNNAISDLKFNPHVFGPSSEGRSEYAHYAFIDKYRTTNISQLDYPDYLKLHDWSPERKDEIDELTDIEETSIQLEMLIYIKFWEADMIIKKLYQFVRILYGEPYDWYFKIQESARDKDATGSRQDIIRIKIRDRILEHSPILYELIKSTYKTQIRNSIAHSNYSFLGRNIHPNNFIEGDKSAQLHAISFDEWIAIFHNTLALHNQYIRMNNRINVFYAHLAMKHNNTMEIQVTEKIDKSYPINITYRPEWNDWKFKSY